MRDSERHLASKRIHDLERQNDRLMQTLWVANETLTIRNGELDSARNEIVRLHKQIEAIVRAATE